MLYNGRFNEKHDFIAVEIINQQIQLTFSAGTRGSPRGREGGELGGGAVVRHTKCSWEKAA